MSNLRTIAMLSALMFAGPAAAHQSLTFTGNDLALADRPRRRGKGQNNRRGKGKRNPPKSRPNRITISKRVRRKHRRAA